MADRAARIAAFLTEAGWGGAERRPLAGDASFRRYERLTREGERAVLMDAPPPHEDVAAFQAVAELLVDLGLSAPRVYAADVAAGLALIEDLGDTSFTRALAGGAAEGRLYRLATDMLISLHRRWPEPAPGAPLPPYDETRFLDEALLLTDWYVPAVSGRPIPAEARAAYAEAWRRVLPAAERLPQTLVLRDFHVDNLMLLEDRPGVAACGLLDFQDAVIGPCAYDLVSLLEDARRDVPAALAEDMLARYLDAFPALEPEAFRAGYAVMGAQRNAKIVGIFTRLAHRDGKDGYLRHIPRVWRLLEGDLAHAALGPVRAWFDEWLPAAQRRVPAAEAPA